MIANQRERVSFESCNKWQRRLPVTTLAFAASLAAMCVNTADLPPEVQADRLLLEAERKIEQEWFVDASITLGGILALQAEHGLEVPVAFWFKYAYVAHKAGLQTETLRSGQRNSLAAEHYAKSVKSVTRYLATVGPEGDKYVEALNLLDASESAAAALAFKMAEEEATKAAAFEAVKRGEPLEMVAIPAGRYLMGCVSGRDCDSSEVPVHWVRIEQPFSMSKYETTFAQWDACVSDGACSDRHPYDWHWGRGNQPVIDVSWDDVQLYVKWLSEQTGHVYRLPTEAEWEYAARAGTTTAYSWGNDLGRNLANCDGCGSSWDNKRTAPVGSFQPNAFGLHDMHGNVWEWVEDCWNAGYLGAPTNGVAWRSGNCGTRVIRGGSWADKLGDWVGEEGIRSARRGAIHSDYQRHNGVGFRVVRLIGSGELELLDAAKRAAGVAAAQAKTNAAVHERFATVEGPVDEDFANFADSLMSGGRGPEMVTIRAGSFRMGCLLSDENCFASEKSAREVTIPTDFALSKYEVTVADFRSFVEATEFATGDSCTVYNPVTQELEEQDNRNWRDPGDRQSDASPVVCVSWQDAKAYVDWLSRETGEVYRLPSESEWEYAARAGTVTKYSWGNEVDGSRANCFGCELQLKRVGWTTTPVGAFPPNPFGLYDMHGNVWEWVEDCAGNGYKDAPSDGSAVTGGDCDQRLQRGGSWLIPAWLLSSSIRAAEPSFSRWNTTGFRVARTLNR